MARRWFQRPGPLFLIAVVLGAAVVVAYFALSRPKVVATSGVRRLTNDVSISSQIKPIDVDKLRQQGFRTIIDLRPDGEAPDQPSFPIMQGAVSKAGLGFSYVPVKHGAIGRPSVKALATALRMLPKPALLYCSSGRRAGRTWALAEASKPGGLDASAIRSALENAGVPSDDLTAEITSRIAARSAETAAPGH